MKLLQFNLIGAAEQQINLKGIISMACKESFLDLEVIQTDTKTWRFVIKNQSGQPIDISGYLLFFTVKKDFSALDTSAFISKTVTCPANTDSQNGIGFIELSSADTNIPAENYVYDMKIQKNDGVNIIWRKTIATGKFKVNVTGTKRIS